MLELSIPACYIFAPKRGADLQDGRPFNIRPIGGYVHNGEVALRYVDWGGAGRRHMVLLHGMRDCARSWDTFARAMAGEYEVIALDSRGHGDSDRAGPGGYTFADHVSDVKALYDGLGLEDTILVGHSAGGRYAWAYAVENPDRVRALVIVDIDPDPQNPQTDRDFAAIASEPASWDTIGEFTEALRARQVYTGDAELRTQARALSRLTDDGKYVWKADIRIVTEYERPDLWESWGRISCPVLLVRGRQSALLTHETAVRMREALPVSQVRLAELEGGGHWFHQDFPGAFEAAARWFLEENSAPPG